jgi:wobble nucleotide-excising tRNase
MLTSKRKVFVTPEFSVRVTDSFNDESKSEGQFAVVSFAYIGGILKMLRSEQHLRVKEYPLVLDGPFSKLDPDQRQNVVSMIPKFAPQVILFSKDDLHGVFDEKDIGRVWTIVSNDEKNVARVEEGCLWK